MLLLTLSPCSYDAHPMAILTSAFAYLGSYYSEANPSLQGPVLTQNTPSRFSCFSGQNIFTKGDKASLALLDKQIYRLIGKATTLAAYVMPVCHVSNSNVNIFTSRMAYRVRQGREFVTPPTNLSYTGSSVPFMPLVQPTS